MPALDYIKYLINLIPEKARKYAIYAPAAALTLLATIALGFDAANPDFAWDQTTQWILTGIIAIGSAVHSLSSYKTVVPVESE